MTQSSQGQYSMPPFDPAAMQAMWQQMMGQFAQTAGRQPPPANMPADAYKQMQKMYLEMMARWADEYMRSEPFLDQMKQSLEGALAMRRQVEEFIRKASEQSYGSTLGIYDAVGAVRDAESWITRRIDELAERLGAIEAKLGIEGQAGKGRTSPARTGAGRKKAGKRPTSKKKTSPAKKTRKRGKRAK